MDNHLAVYIAGVRAGTLRQGESGELSFSYDAGYSGIPLSLAMPISNRTYGDKIVRPYFMGLLPDSSDVRRSLGRLFGVSGENPFALLRHIGLDCPGAVQVCDGDPTSSFARNAKLVAVSDAEIAERLSTGRASSTERWEAEGERWSLGGQQSKFALRKEGNHWFSCEGAAATTHIFKPGIPGLRSEALNEYLCLKLARACGIPASRVEYLIFDEEPSIVVERYDRVRNADGEVIRLHQEDFCQALSVLSQNKYPEDGGPSAGSIIGILRRTGAPAAANVTTFMKMLFFNYLTASPDAHAKNYSMLHDRDGSYLAPLYDVASMLPYANRRESIRLTMGIAGENRVAMLSSRRLSRFSQANALDEYGLNGDALSGMLASLAQKIPDALKSVLESSEGIPGVGELGFRLLSGVEEICSKSLARLG